MTARLLVSGSRKHSRTTMPIIIAGLVEAGAHLGRDTVLVHGGQGYRDHLGQVVRGADLLAAEQWEHWGLPTRTAPGRLGRPVSAGLPAAPPAAAPGHDHHLLPGRRSSLTQPGGNDRPRRGPVPRLPVDNAQDRRHLGLRPPGQGRRHPGLDPHRRHGGPADRGLGVILVSQVGKLVPRDGTCAVTLDWGRCANRATMQATSGCEHEHLSICDVCPDCVALAQQASDDGTLKCFICRPDHENCRVRVVRVVSLTSEPAR